MKFQFYDITRELFSTAVYPGDPVPQKEPFYSMEKGDPCNLTVLSMGSHTGTHMDAPRHFVRDGKDIAALSLSQVMGDCKVVEAGGALTGQQAGEWLSDGTEKLLIKGEILVTPGFAQATAEHHLALLGVEGQTVGKDGTQQEIHQILLGAETVILEGLTLAQVPPGKYFLAAQPLKMAGLDGSPVRAVLVCRQDTGR